jgi:hypothetical protein
MIKDLIKKTVNENQGIKATELAVSVTTALLEEKQEWTQDQFFKALEELVHEREIVEVSYVLPTMDYKVKSIYFPKGTEVSIVS